MNITTTQNKTKNKFGQYFTPEIVADFMIELANISANSKVLEPSCGEGVFLKLLQQRGYSDITAYEIDSDLALDYPYVKYESFVSANIDTKFDLIIGNPPYIRWKNLEAHLKQELTNNPLWNKYFNSLCDYLYIFILKSIELLAENGQLIFICPEYWMSTTHSIKLRNYMLCNGYFEEIYHFNETPIFDKVAVSIVIFKYIKSKNKKSTINVAKYFANRKLTSDVLDKLYNKELFDDVNYLRIPQFQTNDRWLLESEGTQVKLKIFETACLANQFSNTINIFADEEPKFNTIGDYCDIGNGLVSGLDKAFQVNGFPLNDAELQSTLNVVKAKDLSPYFANNFTKYIFVKEGLAEDEFKATFPSFYLHFQKYRDDLGKRYQYNKTINYWEWVFLRNFNLFSRDEKRIFVPCKERISNKDYFRFSLVDSGVFPTQDVTAIFKKKSTKESIEYILAFLNNPAVFEWLKCNGIVKGSIVEFSEKPISSIPFRAIDWNKPNEIALHNSITNLANDYLISKDKTITSQINQLFNELFEL